MPLEMRGYNVVCSTPAHPETGNPQAARATALRNSVPRENQKQNRSVVEGRSENCQSTMTYGQGDRNNCDGKYRIMGANRRARILLAVRAAYHDPQPAPVSQTPYAGEDGCVVQKGLALPGCWWNHTLRGGCSFGSVSSGSIPERLT